MTTQEKTLRERFKEEFDKHMFCSSHKFFKEDIFSFIEKALTTRENEIIEMIDKKMKIHIDNTMVYLDLKDIKSKILNKSV